MHGAEKLTECGCPEKKTTGDIREFGDAGSARMVKAIFVCESRFSESDLSAIPQGQRTTTLLSKLRPYPIPEPLRDYTAYHVLRRGARWKQIRQDSLSAAGRRCATCGVGRGILSCHGTWTYDDQLSTVTLTGFVILCTDCTIATHIAQSIRRGFGDLAVRQLSRVNRITLADAERLATEAMTIWKERNKKSWYLRVAPHLVDRYPQLRELSSSQADELRFRRR